MRVHLPNRPGALGAVASALGAMGADINLVEILQKRGDIEIDEFILDLPRSQTVESLVATCDALDGVQVQWVRNYPRGGDITYDIELHERMAADRDHAGEILTAAAPLVFRADWSLLMELSSLPRVVYATPTAPPLDTAGVDRFRPFDTIHRIVLEPEWRPGAEAHHAALAPIAETQAVIIGRRGEPPFFRSELARLAYLVGDTGRSDSTVQPSSPSTSSQLGHRTPVTTPLYTRTNDGS